MMDKGIQWFAKMQYNIQHLYLSLDLKSSIFKCVWLCHPDDFSKLLFEKCFGTDKVFQRRYFFHRVTFYRFLL
jgi:hypothetical protein